MSGAKRLRDALASGEQIVAPGVHDPLSAKAVASLGFNGIDLGGFASAASLGAIEPLMTMTEQVDLARRVVATVGDVPVIADAHTGYGDAIHITRAIGEFEAAGVAAIHVEDQVFPKQASYHDGRKHVVSLEEMRARLGATLDARSDHNLMVIARTDARAAAGGSLDAAIERLGAYREAGADALMPMPHGRVEARKVREAFPDTPLAWIAGLGKLVPPTWATSDPDAGEEIHVDELAELGYEIVMYGVVGIVRAVDALIAAYAELKETGVVDVEGIDVGYKQILGLLDAPRYYEIEAGELERARAPSESP